MSRVCLVALLLVAVLPRSGLAQAPSPPPLLSAPPASEQPPPVAEPPEDKPKGEIIPRPWQPQGSGRRAGRIVVETLSGILGATLIGGSALGASYAIQFSCDGCSDVTASTILAVVGVAGVFGGLSLGVTLGGHLMDGQGRFLPALAGTGLGLLAGGAVATVLGTQVDEVLIIPPLILGPLAGAVIGYEFSHDNESAKAAGAPPAVSFVPTFTVRPSGGVVAGLVGRF